MFYLDTQRTITRRDSSLITRNVSAESITGRGTGTISTFFQEVPQEARVRGSVQREITSLFFETMLNDIVDTWEVLDIKEKKKKKVEKPEKPEKAQYIERFGLCSYIGQSWNNLIYYILTCGIILPYIFPIEPVSIVLDTVWWSALDEKAVIHFKNGNIYEGDISLKCMHGEGRFQWADGTIYIGHFQDNQIEGRGTIQWKNDSWYTGEFVGNLRHGKGLYVDSRCQRCYFGDWHCGTKDGHGTMYHSGDFSNSYEGEWYKNSMHGNGLRQYCNQSAYSGDFEYSTREGTGDMIYPNHDIYRGQWTNGIIDGIGYYTWNCMRNETMSVPFVISYYGTWLKGLRNGYGLLRLGPGLVPHYKGRFKNDLKQGRGQFMTVDGIIVSDKTLFVEDKYRPEKPTFSIPIKQSIKKRLPQKGTLLCDNTRTFLYHIVNAVKNHVEHEHNARISMVNDFIENNGLNGSTARTSEMDKINKLFDDDVIYFENRSLRLVSIHYESNLNDIYHLYLKICNTEPIYFSAVLIRLYFWQFCYDCNFHEKGLTLTQIDDVLSRNKHLIVIDPHDPFERIYRWQFMHSLITLACHFYVGTTLPGPRPDTMVASAFSHFMETDVLPNFGRCKGKLVMYSFVPLQATYALYLSLEEPRTVRKFLCAARISSHLYLNRLQPSLINAEEEVIPRGRNCYLFGDKMIFVHDKLFVFPPKNVYYDIPNDLQLLNFGNLSSKCIIQQFANIIPNLMVNDKIMNIEKEITFYEFFEAFIGCTEESIRVKEEELQWKAYRE